MDPVRIGNLIKELRIKSNLTQNEFANKYGVTYQAVSKWENGKNIPDISVLKLICEDYNISLDSVLDGKVDKKKKKLIFIGLTTLVILLIVIASINFQDNQINFKIISSSCEDFNIYGSLAYNKSDSHLHLGNVTYCGGDDTTKYVKIECGLYEKKDDKFKVLDTCKYNYDGSIKLEDYLENIDFDLKDFSNKCDKYDNNSLYILINATDNEGNITKYQIPLNLSNTCNKK